MELCSGGSLFTLLENPANTYGFMEDEFKQVLKDVGKNYYRPSLIKKYPHWLLSWWCFSELEYWEIDSEKNFGGELVWNWNFLIQASMGQTHWLFEEQCE